MPTPIQSLDEALMTLVGPRGLTRIKNRLQREIRVQHLFESVGFYLTEEGNQRQRQKILAMVTEVLTDFGGERKQEPTFARDDATGTNIDRLLTFLTQRCNHSRIQKWRQEIENQQAKDENRTPKRIAIKTANLDFRRALKSDRSPRKKAAWELAREFLKQPDIVAYYKKKKDEDLPEPEVVKEPTLQVQAALQHFATQAIDKLSQAQSIPAGKKRILLRQQAECLDNLRDALARTAKRMDDANIMEKLIDDPSFSPKADESWVIAYWAYAQLMQKAVKLDLGNDPVIRQWHTLHNRQAGGKGILSKPISPQELEIHCIFDTMINQEYSLNDIQQELTKENLIPVQSQQAFHRFVARRQLQELYSPNE